MQNRKKILSVTIGTVLTAVSIFAVGIACTEQAKAKPNIVHKDTPPKPGIVAKIGDQEFTEDQLIGDDKLDFFDLQKREYELKMDRVNKLMVDTLVGAEAKKAGMSLDDYLDKKVTHGDVKVSEKDYKKFVADKHIPESQINPQIKERIMNYLQAQKKQDMIENYVAKLTKNNPVEVYFKKPKMEVKVDIGNAPMWGNKDAPVTIVEFSDFQCPFCGRAATTLEALQKKYKGKINIAYKAFPLPMHPNARPAAEASFCVNEQGNDKFWKFHDIAFANQAELDPASLEKYAKQSGADVDKYKACVASKKYADYVQKDMEYGEKLGVKSTPTFFINGQLVSGAVPIDDFSSVIDEELGEAHK